MSMPRESTVAISFKIIGDGEKSWRIHLMNMVDEFNTTYDERLFVLPPHPKLNARIAALIAGTIVELCHANKMTPPDWALTMSPLEKPWFVSGIENLKASALVESPMGFRMKNIFVLENFLSRA